MKNHLNKSKIIVAMVLCLTLLVIIFGNYYFDQISGWAGPISITLILLLTLFIIVQIIIWLFKIYKLRSELKLKPLIPLVIYLITLILVFTSPRWLYANYYLSKIVYRGCYEGTMNTATIYFRESGEFEYRDVGFFGFTVFKKGTWTKEGDTIKIKYVGNIQEFVGNKLMLTESEFVNISNDSIDKNRKRFYRGYCKGLN